MSRRREKYWAVEMYTQRMFKLGICIITRVGDIMKLTEIVKKYILSCSRGTMWKDARKKISKRIFWSGFFRRKWKVVTTNIWGKGIRTAHRTKGLNNLHTERSCMVTLKIEKHLQILGHPHTHYGISRPVVIALGC